MMMDRFLKSHKDFRFSEYEQDLARLMDKLHDEYDSKKPHINELERIVSSLPDVTTTNIDLSADSLKIGDESDVTTEEKRTIDDLLMKLTPWRKGPFSVFGVDLDTEWRSDLKWNRVIESVSDLEDRRILDIGCSSGYYMFKMAAMNPRFVLGIDPYHRFYYQFKALQKYIKSDKTFFIPARFEDFPVLRNYFDTIFFMGILYHRKSPIDTLTTIHKNLRKDGELVLETLIIEGEDNTALFPEDRYAKMRNVFFIPTVPCLETWLRRTGFKNIRCVDITPTTLSEQRKTRWINTESLEDFLDPTDNSLTVEGYPAPVRATLIANAK